MKNKGYKIIFFVYIFLLILDIVTTLMNYKFLDILEMNPIYQYVGIPGIIVINLLVIGVFIYYMNKPPDICYIAIQIMVMIIFGRLIAIRNAINLYLSDITVEQAAAIITPAVKAAQLKSFMILEYLPFFIGLVSYFFWRLDHKVVKKGSN